MTGGDEGLTRRAGVLGHPIAHSLSPVLHRAAYDLLGLAGWTYEAYDVTADRLGEFLGGLDNTWAGLSLTMPLKAAVLPLLDEATPLAKAVGAANTVVLSGGRCSGENTDVPGMVAALADHGIERVDHIAVLGGGATARSALAAAAALGASARVHSRTPARADALHETADAVGLTLEVHPWEDAPTALAAPVVINTTPAGAADALIDALPAQPGTLFEVLYDPWPTKLAAAWSERGGQVVGGLDLLVHQAVLQVGLMTGARVDVPGFAATLREAGERALRAS